jgi:iron complex transport system permease protein
MKLAAVLALAVAGALLAGPAGVSPEVVALRAPRVAAAVVCGAGLALAGVAMQSLLRNALADPFILGMAGGASLGAVGALLVSVAIPPALAGAAGAFAAATLVGRIGRTPEGRYPPTRLILSGVAVSAVLGGATNFLLHLAPQARAVRAALYWTSGSLGAATGTAVLVAALVTALAAAWLWRRSGDVDRLLLGEDTAASLGVGVARLRLGLLVVGVSLTGAIVACGGPIGFVGLAAPHLARLQVGATHARLLPVAALLGALLLLVADTAARAAFPPRELPTGVLTALLGGPFFLYLLRDRAYGFGEAA